MIRLFQALAPEEGVPELLRDPKGAFSRRQGILASLRRPTV
jgi:hypothetical protein